MIERGPTSIDDSPMKISLITPAPRGSRNGNRITALRWAWRLRELGHRVRISQSFAREPADLLVALHARKSFESIQRFRRFQPNAPIVLALTGTDVYGDIHTDASAIEAIEMATRLIVLQPMAANELPAPLRAKVRVIHQSVTPVAERAERFEDQRDDVFEVCVIGHLREVKDPFRAAEAVRTAPRTSRIVITHIGRALNDAMRRRAVEEMNVNPRYTWLGELSRRETRRIMARSRLLALTSLMEGGANVISEAVVEGVPIISSRISGSIGLLGEDYAGYFEVGDTDALAAALHRAETDPTFLASLRLSLRRIAPLFDPARERQSWADLLHELQTGVAGL